MPETYPIGQLARLSGVPVKTIRYYADEGLLPPSARTPAGHRRFDEADLARLQLIRSLRELGVDLPTIKAVLAGHAELGSLLGAHIRTLETRVRGLQRQLVVLRAAGDSPSPATVRRVQALAQLDATERRGLFDRFWDRVSGDTPSEGATRLRHLGTVDLPDDPTPDQLDAWIELAELVADEDFQATTQRNAEWLPNAAKDGVDMARLQEGMGQAVATARPMVVTGLEPTSPEADAAAQALVAAYAAALGREPDADFARWLLEMHDAHTDPRAARYWELVGIITNRVPTEEQRREIGLYPWLIEALRAKVARSS
ncbi:MAG TPA: MerR family transcriptional regulator [Candidatus Limnocylindria bacterium]|nr:MerR family transcriptional regulator [Candidatus Limnocylindria bacterium]